MSNEVETVSAEPRPYVTMERYAEIHNASNSLAEVAEKTGLKLSSIRTKIVQVNKFLTANGADPLKKFPSTAQRGRAKRDPAAIVAAAQRGLEVSQG